MIITAALLASFLLDTAPGGPAGDPRPALLILLAGWSQVVAGHELRSSGPLNPDQRRWLDAVTGSGPVLSASFGFAAAGG